MRRQRRPLGCKKCANDTALGYEKCATKGARMAAKNAANGARLATKIAPPTAPAWLRKVRHQRRTLGREKFAANDTACH